MPKIVLQRKKGTAIKEIHCATMAKCLQEYVKNYAKNWKIVKQ
jgi:hypothetical protein